MTTRAKRATPVPPQSAAGAGAAASLATSSTTFHPDDESVSMASAVAATEAQGSSVREAFRLMATLIYPAIPIAYLDRCARILQRRHMETVFEERAVQLLCAFPPCANKLSGKNAKYRVSLKKKEIYDAHTENQFCSEQCLKKARVFVSRLVTKPPQLMPSLVDTFGSDKPNPFKWEKQQQELALQAAASTKHDGAATTTTAGSNAHRHGFGRRAATAPQAKTVWSKTSDLGIVERPPVAAIGAISENVEPAAPATEFPDAASAVLIEGFVFPSHKKSLAKKVERKWQDTSTSRGDEIVVSDSEESDAGDSDAESSSGSSSLDIESDFDPEDAEEELISSDDLPLFINIWRMFSTWITHDTTLLVAGKPLTQKTELPKPQTAQEKKDRDAADRAAQLVFHERYTAFSLFLGRPLLPVAQQLQLPCDRYATHRIDSLVKSFVFREAIDGRNTQQWSCIAALLLLVAYNKQVSNMAPEMLAAAQRATQLDAHELDQLLALFYTLRNDSEIVVDDDVAARPTDGAASKATNNGDSTMPKCRRCRRTQAKCVCSTRTPTDKTLAAAKPAQEFSTDELAQMFRDAATLREHYEDLVEAAGGNYDDID